VRLVIVIVSRRLVRAMVALMILTALLPGAFTGLATVVNGRLLRPRVDVVIDPGHGGVDPGANDHDTLEKDITLAISLKMRDMLVRYGMSVGLTRDSDTDCSGWAQLRTGRHQADLNARARTMNLGRVAISVHVNTSTDPNQRGAMVLYASGSDQGLRLAGAVLSQLSQVTELNHKSPVPRTNLLVLTATDVPAVLVEIGFLSNPTDKNNMKDPAFQERLASAIARAVIDYLSAPAERETGPVQASGLRDRPPALSV